MIASFFAELAGHFGRHESVYFPLLSILLGVLCIGLAWWVSSRLARHLPSSLACLRSRPAGLVLGLICLVWSAHHACVMLEGNLDRFHGYVWMAVPIVAVLSWFFLDFLFARAAGGFFILCANVLIYCAFVHDIPWRPWYSAVCLALGVLGLLAVGAPWRIRDLLQAAAKRSAWAKGSAALLVIFAVTLTALPLLARR